MARRFGRRKTRGGENVGTHGADKRWRSPDGREWDSQLEGLVALWMDAHSVEYLAQPHPISYVTKVRSGLCLDCQAGNVVQQHQYTPDFYVPQLGCYFEVKGFFRQGVRPAMQELMKQNPDLQLRFIFSRNNKLPLKRTPDYLTWAAHYGKMAITWNAKRGLWEWIGE